jgi:hypothetical protein
MLVNARVTINKFIEENEPIINKADYLKSVSVINKCIPSLSELEKRKLKSNL